MGEDVMGMGPGPRGGKVLRLHFTCRAELPIGSSLRVTSSTCWDPGTLMNSPEDAVSQAHYTTNMGQDDILSATNKQTYANLYASTVEMVTTPDEYPLWRTKNPVIVIANRNDINTMTHRYRYVVVTPGAEIDEDEVAFTSADVVMSASDTELDADIHTELRRNNSIMTSIDMQVNIPPVLWEDSFKNDNNIRTGDEMNRSSFVSLPSLKRNKQIKNLSNLPYRTFHIKTHSSSNFKINAPLDTWNNSDDLSYQPYFEREKIRTKKLIIARTQSQNTNSSSINTFQDSDNDKQIGSTYSIATMDAEAIPAKKKERLFLVCFHLPVILTKDASTQTWSATWNESLLSKSPHSILEKSHELHFIGHVTVSNDLESPELDKESIRQVLKPMGCTPIFLDQELMESHYLGMCKQVLWPAFHNIDLLDLSTSGWGQREHLAPKNKDDPANNSIHNKFRSVIDSSSNPSSPMNKSNNDGKKIYTNVRSTIESDWDQSILDKWWEAYTLVNQIFANALVELLQPGDTTWVHDYHLALLPNMLDSNERSRFGQRATKMVFFLHIPFPTSQIFRELECGEAILQGMLHADVVGFHAFDHARHFLNAAKRILGLNYESLVGGLIGVQYRGKKVLVTMSNVSIEPYVIDKAITLPSVINGTQALKTRHNDRTIISGVDIAQRLSGITFKLLAFERLLTDYPVWKDKAVMVQRCLIPESRRADETNTVREVRFLIRRIQEKFGQHVIDYQEVKGSSLPIEQRLSLWRASDCMMLSPVREGLNLMPMEYVYARKNPMPAGVTIASEFSAVCSILNGALRVNPFDIQLTAANIDKALSMDVKEKESRRARDIDFVSNFPKEKWTRNVLRDLEEAARASEEDDYSEEKKQDNEAIDSMSTAAFLARENEIAFTHISNHEVKEAYDVSSRRVILLDFNGTIVIKEPPGKYLKREILGTSGLKPPTSVVKALTELVADPRNLVYVVSGDAQENVENAIGHVAGLGLAASNGACFSSPVKRGETRRTWQTLDLGVDWDAVKKVSLPVLSKYTARTNGSFIKLTHSSIGWSYYSCDPEWGLLQASHLVMELESELRAFDVRFVTLKGIVEIVPRRMNKGLIVKKVLQDAAAANGGAGVDFILCMGDDISDEKMFSSVLSFVAEMEDNDGNTSQWSSLQMDPKKSSSSLNHNDMIVDRVSPILNERKNKPMHCYTVTVGRKPSKASQYVDDAKDVANLLVTMSGGRFDARSMSFDENDIGGSSFFA